MFRMKSIKLDQWQNRDVGTKQSPTCAHLTVIVKEVMPVMFWFCRARVGHVIPGTWQSLQTKRHITMNRLREMKRAFRWLTNAEMDQENKVIN